MATKELDDQVRDALNKKSGDWQMIAAKAKVSGAWIKLFMDGKIANPGLKTLQRVRDAMK